MVEYLYIDVRNWQIIISDDMASVIQSIMTKHKVMIVHDVSDDKFVINYCHLSWIPVTV